MIELDFKQRIKIGMGPRQVASQYFNQKEILCLGRFFAVEIKLKN